MIEKGTYVLVRCYGAGVHAGVLEELDVVNKVAWISDSRRLWRWWSQFTLSELADMGVQPGKEGECKFSAPTVCTVALAEWCEVRPCSPEAEASIRGIRDANT